MAIVESWTVGIVLVVEKLDEAVIAQNNQPRKWQAMCKHRRTQTKALEGLSQKYPAMFSKLTGHFQKNVLAYLFVYPSLAQPCHRLAPFGNEMPREKL